MNASIENKLIMSKNERLHSVGLIVRKYKTRKIANACAYPIAEWSYWYLLKRAITGKIT